MEGRLDEVVLILLQHSWGTGLLVEANDMFLEGVVDQHRTALAPATAAGTVQGVSHGLCPKTESPAWMREVLQACLAADWLLCSGERSGDAQVIWLLIASLFSHNSW